MYNGRSPSSERTSRPMSLRPLQISSDSPASGASAAPVDSALGSVPSSATQRQSSPVSAAGQLSSPSSFESANHRPSFRGSHQSLVRPRSHSSNETDRPAVHLVDSPGSRRMMHSSSPGTPCSHYSSARRTPTEASIALAKARARTAQKVNDAMVYLDGPQVYTCAQCRTHLTSHDDIISKSFHGRHGRAYLFDQCVNIKLDPSEDRRLITGLHSVSDIRCKRCETIVGWTYLKAYESSQKYKEGKFIIEKINLHLEESDYYDVSHPAGERSDRWRLRSMSWGSEPSGLSTPPSPQADIIYEYRPRSSSTSSVPITPKSWTNGRSMSMDGPSARQAESEGPPLPPL